MLVPVLVLLIVVGVALWLLRGRIDPTVYTIIICLLVLAVALWILNAFGLVSIPSAFQLRGAK
jgi:hypothetical protein